MSMKEGGEFGRRSIVLMKMIFKYRNFNHCFFRNDSVGIENEMGMIFAIFIRRRPGSAGFLWGMDEALAVQFRAAGKEKRATGARMATIRAEEGRAAVTRVAAPCVPGEPRMLRGWRSAPSWRDARRAGGREAAAISGDARSGSTDVRRRRSARACVTAGRRGRRAVRKPVPLPVDMQRRADACSGRFGRGLPFRAMRATRAARIMHHTSRITPRRTCT
ncbi:hypothetical protein [Burkholderia pseudomallei]|uniref:hypothetical protein n=1 Tax=Burkholderia pseudomallei TaxID=28450 RepID=UPI001E311087|nr:hypothetical protein [Burkholderia pseudomallei]